MHDIWKTTTLNIVRNYIHEQLTSFSALPAAASMFADPEVRFSSKCSILVNFAHAQFRLPKPRPIP